MAPQNLLFGTNFDTLYPEGSDFDTITSGVLVKLGDMCSCSEDNERYTRTEGAIDMLDELVMQGHITPSVARTMLRGIWRNCGLEPETED